MREQTYFSGFPKVMTAFCSRCGKKRQEYRIYLTVATMSSFVDIFFKAEGSHDNNSYKPNIVIWFLKYPAVEGQVYSIGNAILNLKWFVGIF